MAVVIRLKRTGTTKKPHWRLVATDEKSPRDGRFIEELGHYHPMTEPAGLTIKKDRLEYWMKQGARLSKSAKTLIKKV